MRALLSGSLLLVAVLCCTSAFAEPAACTVIKRDDGTWGGISMDLWKEVAARAKLDYERIAVEGYKDAPALVDGLAKGDIDAVVFEAPILNYNVKAKPDANLVVLDGTFDNHGYAFALAQCSPVREAVNLALLQTVASDDWQAILTRYLGSP